MTLTPTAPQSTNESNQFATKNARNAICTAILKPFKEGGAGPYLRFEPVYDAIREARRFDDPTLSRGVWQIDLKKADFDLVERLCIETLTRQSKDFQILVWLSESWFVLHGIEGGVDALSLMDRFLNDYWDSFYPQDFEYRFMLFDWVDEVIKTRLFFMPLFKAQHSDKYYSFQDYNLSKLLEKAIKRDPSKAQSLIDEGKKRGEFLFKDINDAISAESASHLNNLEEGFKKCLEILTTLKLFLDNKMGKDAPSFHQTIQTLEELIHLTHREEVVEEVKIEEKQSKEEKSVTLDNSNILPDHVTDNTVIHEGLQQSHPVASLPIKEEAPLPSLFTTDKTVQASQKSDRAEAYEALRRLATLFETVDPHGPTANMLHTIATWETMTLPDILNDFTKGGDALSLFMRLIAKKS